MKKQILFATAARVQAWDDTHVAHVPGRCTDKRSFFQAIQRELEMPDYFGCNWDALFDVLRDLSWISRHRIVLFHAAVPFVDPGKNRTYLKTLADALLCWTDEDESHELLAVFDPSTTREVSSLLAEISFPPDAIGW